MKSYSGIIRHRSRIATVSVAALIFAACGSAETSATVTEAESVEAVADAGADSAASETEAPEESTADSNESTDEVDEPAETTTTTAAPEVETEPLGSGTIVLDGVEYFYETTFCANDEDGLFNYGAGVTDDGVPFVVEAYVWDSRRLVLDINVNFGQESIYSPPDLEQPLYYGNTNSYGGDVTVEGNRIVGSTNVEAQIVNEGATVPIEIDADCQTDNAPDIDLDNTSVEGNYCQIAQLEAERAESLEGTLPTPEVFETYIADGLDLMSQIEDRPSEIAEDIAIVEASLDDLDQRAAAVDYDFTASLIDIAETIGAQDVINAGLRIAAFNEAACGIEGPNQ